MGNNRNDLNDQLRRGRKARRATPTVAGKSARSRWFDWRHQSVVDPLVRKTVGLEVNALPLDELGPTIPRARHSRSGSSRRRSDYLWTACMVAGVTGLGSGLNHLHANLGNVALLYLLPVMAAASLFGLRAGLFGGLLSSLAYNFFFLPPTGTLTISNPENVVTIFVLLGVAFVTSQFAARTRAQAELARASARANAALAGFLGRLTQTANEKELAQAICGEIGRIFDVRAIYIAKSGDGVQEHSAIFADDGLDTIALAAVNWVLERGLPAGRGSDTLTASDWLFYPLRNASHTLAAIGLSRDDSSEPISSNQLPLLMNLLDQAAVAIERARLTEEMRDVAQLKERDRLRAALLSSVSHDLRTPLTAILAAASELRRGEAPLQATETIATIESEAERLNRFVANLLDMARVEAGAIKLKIEAVDLADAIASAVHDTRRALDGHAVELDVAPDLPLIRIDPQLFHHVLINLLDNAGRYAEPGTPITIQAEREPGSLTLSVLDRGPGLPPGRERDLFETFRRIEGSDRNQSGTGLGLAIVKGFAEAMGLTVEAANRGGPAGARFTIRFPEAALISALEEQ